MTALEWLEDNLIFVAWAEEHFIHNKKCWEQAKQMEMNQLEKFYHHGMFAILDGNGHGEEFIDYFKKTFKQK